MRDWAAFKSSTGRCSLRAVQARKYAIIKHCTHTDDPWQSACVPALRLVVPTQRCINEQ